MHQKEHLNLTKEVKNKYTENFKTFITEMEEDTDKWKILDILCSGTGRINIAKMTILPKEIYRCNANPYLKKTNQ